jgi:multidrug efflux pump subunit AcrA (membrane-fusion protein)
MVQVGQPASITFDAILDQVYQGEVTQIGQIGTSSQGTVSFSVTVRMLNPGPLVRSGMTAIANITVAQAEDILQLPSTVIQEDDGKRYVYLLPEGGSPADARQGYVQIGLTSDTASGVISSELKEGDKVMVSSLDCL